MIINGLRMRNNEILIDQSNPYAASLRKLFMQSKAFVNGRCRRVLPEVIVACYYFSDVSYTIAYGSRVKVSSKLLQGWEVSCLIT